MDRTITGKHARVSKQAAWRAFGVYFASAVCIMAAVIVKFVFLAKINTRYSAVAYLLFSVTIAVILLGHHIYVVFSRAALVRNLRTLGAVYTAMTLSVIANIFLESVSAFLMPAMLAAYIAATFSNGRDAFVANLFSNVLVFFILMTQNHFVEVNYYGIVAKFAQGLAAGSVVAYWVSSGTKRLMFLWKGFVVGVLSIGAVYAMTAAMGERNYRLTDLAFLMTGTFGQVIAAVILQPVFEAVFNLVTNTRLMDLTDHNAPLIKRLREEAPGTFNHCLAVANFAEVCAAAIGENPYMARACAYYHDVGKLKNPIYFKENQADENPHDELLPEVSAEIIRSHTTEGKKLCDEHRIPHEISDVTVQHHGTLPIYVFYNKAKQLTDGEVDITEYSYHGKTPVSKVAAIIMLCDTGEAAIRAMDNPDAERVDKLLKKLINDRIAAGQFDDCDITLRDLDTIRQTIMSAYGGQFHKRLRYPDGGSAR